MTEQRVADPLAEASVAEIQNGMLVGLGVWTWTVMARSHALEARLAAAEAALALSTEDVDLVAEGER